MILTLFAFLGIFAAVEGSLEICAVPMMNRYTPNVFAIEKVPEGVHYDEKECMAVASYVFMTLKDYQDRGLLNPHEFSKAQNSLFECKDSICDKRMLKKLQEPMVAAELAILAVSNGKIFEPDYGVFNYLVDPFYWEIMTGVPYPIVQQHSFPEQNEAAFQIISKVCGHQKPTWKAALFPEIINEIFVGILIERYVRDAFEGTLFDQLIHATDSEMLQSFWNEAARQRDSYYVCLDYELTNEEERTTISKIRDISKRLGIRCTAPTEDGSDSVFASFSAGAPPAGPSGSSGGPPASSASWAAAPSSSSGSSSFAPGPSG